MQALLKEGSVSRAATALGRSPSAVSEALSQLRSVLGDALFTRIGGGLQPTPKAIELAGPLDALHEQLEHFFITSVFDPKKSDRKFIIASSDFLISWLGPGLVRGIRDNSPQISLQFVDIGYGLTDQMASREIDFALLPEFAIADLAPAPLRFQALSNLHEHLALMDAKHPLADKRKITGDDLSKYKHVKFWPSPVLTERHKDSEAAPGDNFEAAIFSSQFLTIPQLVEGTDLIAVVPRPIAESAVKHLNLVMRAFGQYRTGRLGMAWSPIYDQDPAHQWFRKTVSRPLPR